MEEEKHESKGKKEHKAQEDHTHPADMTSQWIIALAVIQVILLAVVAFQLYDIGKKSEESKQSLASINAFFTLVKEQTQPTGNDAQPSQPSAPSRVEGDLKDDDVVQGDANAPVTIVEFSDFQCPYCGRNFEQTYPQIKKLYIDTGKVKYVMRDFPLNVHPEAQKAAEAAGCAEEQGKFWEMHDKLFSNQQDLSVANEKTWAQEIGLDTKKFGECLDSGKRAAEVQKDIQDGQAYGVSGTPAFFINGVPLVGAQPFAAFQQVIEQELAQ